YTGSLRQLQRRLGTMRPSYQERFYVKKHVIAGEQAQVDWGHFGKLRIGKAERNLSAFVMTLSWSRKIFVYFTFDQRVETLLSCHVKAFQALGGVPRSILYDNMKSVVQERLGNVVRYHDALVEFCQHWLFEPSVCAPYHPESKGRVERSIRYFRGSFFEGRAIADIGSLNRECILWCSSEALERKWPDDPARTVAEAFLEEQRVLLPLPDIARSVPRKLILRPDRYGYVHFDKNQYSVPLATSGHVLTLWSYEHEVVIMDGSEEVARHRRSYDAGEKIETEAHRAEVDNYRNKPRISRHIARLSEELPELLPLMRLWIEFHLDTKALVNFIQKASRLHGSEMIRLIIQRAIDERASRVQDLMRYLYEILQSPVDNPTISLLLPEKPEVCDLWIRSHDLDTYDDI
ncbi:MAG TPA: IS21 family transposase, partial [Oligoflexus sp.]|uniref:IS21 family transposase n=1 Tax=Oligoflexus sp. TaxID=1971216 RepID=UPI002D64FA05